MVQHDVTLQVMAALLEKIHDALAVVKGHNEQNTERIDVLMQAYSDIVAHTEKQHAFGVGTMEGFWERLGAVEKRITQPVHGLDDLEVVLNGRMDAHAEAMSLIRERLDEIDKRFSIMDVEQCPLRERVDELERQHGFPGEPG